MTVYALGTNATWPFVTLPRFQAQAALARNQTSAAYSISLLPLVTNQDRLAWQNYSVENQGWVQQGMDYLGANKNATPIRPFITNLNLTSEEEPADPYYAPVWQTYPIDKNEILINFNAYRYSFFANVTNKIIEARKAALSEVINLTPNVTTANWPESFMAAPVYGDIYDNSPLVAIIIAILPWHNNFLNLVPNGVNGIYVVVRNTCNQEFTYQVNGPEVAYLGIGDLHDSAYDHLEVTAAYEAFSSTKYCEFSLHIYPSDEFRAGYITNMPKVYTGAVVLIFVLTALVFIMYDCLVERRQQKVMTTANRSNAIVVSKRTLSRGLQLHHGYQTNKCIA